MWFLTYFIVVSNVFLVLGNASLNGKGSIRNHIQRLEQDLAAQKAMNNELRTALHQTRFRRGMVLLRNPNDLNHLNETSPKHVLKILRRYYIIMYRHKLCYIYIYI